LSPTPKRFNETYLGDGVYAFTDSMDQIWLHTQRENGPNMIALDSGTTNALVAYMRRVWPVKPNCLLCGQIHLDIRRERG
jgi:hypothetical protein